MSRLCIAGLILLLATGCETTPPPSPTLIPITGQIRLNQVGFFPDGPKRIAVVDAPEDTFYLIETAPGDTVFTGQLSPEQTWAFSEEKVRLADFSAYTKPGIYIILVPNLGGSAPFSINPNLLSSIAGNTLKALYFQRASMPLIPAHAGAWSRAAGHPDDAVLIHPSAATPARPAESTLASPRGWYDAGDYNKYIVPASFTSYYLFSAYAEAPQYFSALQTNIPESGNMMPDILDEAIWNLRWMLTMQDPADGGLYHKLTHANFSGVVMPEDATEPRYVVKKSTNAALTFAAAMAQASRLLAPLEDVAPGLSDSCMTAALDAWRWARANPDVIYDQNTFNETLDPDITTGTYRDDHFEDEFQWAAAELYLATSQDSFLVAAPLPDTAKVPYWEFSVAMLGPLSLVDHPGTAGDQARAVVLAEAQRLLDLWRTAPYGTSVNEIGDFVWGGNGIIAAKAALLATAYRISGETDYRDAATETIDYLLGRNATGHSFVTGFGSRPPMHPHHRPSEADSIQAPVPGLLVGGPMTVVTPDCEAYPSEAPAQRYLDDWCSYSSNEITTYWNTPLTFATGVLQSIMSGTEN